MPAASSRPITEDLYRFFDREYLVQSNIPGIVEHLRFVYKKFLLVPDFGKNAPGGACIQSGCPPVIRVEDHFETSRELFIDACGDIRRLPCCDVNMLDSYPGDPTDPASTVQGLLLHTVSRLSTERFLVHAGAVSLKGKGLVIAGNVGMGKTTTVLKLVRRGFDFLSDEVASFHLGRRILEPFHRTVNIRNDSVDLVGLNVEGNGALKRTDGIETFWTVAVDSVFPGSLSGACEPLYLLFLQGFGEKTRLSPMSPSNALFRLIRFSHQPITNTASLMYMLAPIVNGLRCFSLVIGETDEATDCIADLFRDDPSGTAVGTE
jgi:hypothetical protein